MKAERFARLARMLAKGLSLLIVGCQAGSTANGAKPGGGGGAGGGGSASTAGLTGWSTAGNDFGTTPLTLYNLGNSQVYTVEIDGNEIYWAGVNVTQAPKAGGGTPVVLGTAPVVYAIRTNGDYVYWLGGSWLMRAVKHGRETGEVTMQEIDLGGRRVQQRTAPQPESVELPWEPPPEALLIDGGYAYIASPGCGVLVQVNLDTRELRTLQLGTGLVPTIGYVHLARHGDALYCGSWQRVFRVQDFSRVTEITAAATRVAGLASTGENLYWLDKLGTSTTDSSAALFMLGEGDSSSRVGDVLISSLGPRQIYFDSVRERIVWADSALMDFSLRTNTGRIWTRSSFLSGGSARDETYLYFARSAPSFGTIERIRLDYSP